MATTAKIAKTLKKPKYKDMKLVKVAYGDDDDQKSFQEMQGLIQAYPNLKGVISPTTVGVAAAARYLSKSPQKGKVKLTGLGFPNQMRKFVKDGREQLVSRIEASREKVEDGSLNAFEVATLKSVMMTDEARLEWLGVVERELC